MCFSSRLASIITVLWSFHVNQGFALPFPLCGLLLLHTRKIPSNSKFFAKERKDFDPREWFKVTWKNHICRGKFTVWQCSSFPSVLCRQKLATVKMWCTVFAFQGCLTHLTFLWWDLSDNWQRTTGAKWSLWEYPMPRVSQISVHLPSKGIAGTSRNCPTHLKNKQTRDQTSTRPRFSSQPLVCLGVRYEGK